MLKYLWEIDICESERKILYIKTMQKISSGDLKILLQTKVFIEFLNANFFTIIKDKNLIGLV